MVVLEHAAVCVCVSFFHMCVCIYLCLCCGVQTTKELEGRDVKDGVCLSSDLQPSNSTEVGMQIS